MKHIALASVNFLDGVTQIRVTISKETVAEYAAAMKDGARFPPADVFRDDKGGYFIADGWHRLLAAQENGDVTFPCTDHEGGREGAIKFSLGANAHHGMPRTNLDKRKAVGLALREFPLLSDRELAKICAVHHDLPASVRKSQLADSASSSESRMGADGKIRQMPKMKHEPRGESEPSEGGAKEPAPPVGGKLADLEAEAAAMRRNEARPTPAAFNRAEWEESTKRLLEFRLSEVPEANRQAAKNYMVGLIDAF